MTNYANHDICPGQNDYYWNCWPYKTTPPSVILSCPTMKFMNRLKKLVPLIWAVDYLGTHSTLRTRWSFPNYHSSYSLNLMYLFLFAYTFFSLYRNLICIHPCTTSSLSSIVPTMIEILLQSTFIYFTWITFLFALYFHTGPLCYCRAQGHCPGAIMSNDK